MKTVAFFNNKGGVGKTTLVYHLAWKFADMGVPVLAVDLDPQANLTAMFIPDGRLEEIWPDDPEKRLTVFGSIMPLLKGVGDISPPHVELIDGGGRIGLIPGDLGLSGFEDRLSETWPKCLETGYEYEAAFRAMSAFHRMMEQGAAAAGAELVLIDVGPNLGAINRSALIASDHLCVPLAPDLFSLQGLKNLGPAIAGWRKGWEARLKNRPKGLSLPEGVMKPAGYVVMQHNARDNRPVRAYAKWAARIPDVYREMVLGESAVAEATTLDDDPNLLALLRHYHSLMPLAMEAKKPLFRLKPADGAVGSHIAAAADTGKDFARLAEALAKRIGLALPAPTPT